MGRLGKPLMLMAVVAYPILLHTFILKEQVEVWQLLFVFSPMLTVAVWVLFRVVSRTWWPLLLLFLAGLVYFVVKGEYGRVGLVAVNGLSHATLNLFLLWLFGRTLMRGREPLITQISRHINGQLKPEIIAYTKMVTVAWCTFFSLQVLVSLTLYIFAPIATWSLFINVLDMPLLILMFTVERIYQRMHFPNHSRTSIVKVIEVFRKGAAASKNVGGEH